LSWESGAIVNTQNTQLRDSRSKSISHQKTFSWRCRNSSAGASLWRRFLSHSQELFVDLQRRQSSRKVPSSSCSEPSSADLNLSLSKAFGAEPCESCIMMRRGPAYGSCHGRIEDGCCGACLHLAVPGEFVGPSRAHTGYVLVLDDLTEGHPRNRIGGVAGGSRGESS